NASLDISFVSATRFRKYARNGETSAIWFTPDSALNPVYISSVGLGDVPPPPADSQKFANPVDQEVYDKLPPKYRSYFDVFSPTEVDQLPPHRPYDCAIEIEEGKSPPFGPIYSLSTDERAELFSYIEKNLKKGFIRRYSILADVATHRKTGQLRLCVDYRGLNAITRKNRYPIPLVSDLLDRVQGCKVFSVFDLK
ncbi:hypothetical protein M422DRAFT_97062, partial [Sphaerobolus stellatus SS14]